MSQQQINFGAYPDDLNADAIRTAFQKVQQNFTELYNGETLTGVSYLKTGNGLMQTQTTGNIRIDANIANITVISNTMKVGVNGNSTSNAFITQSSDFLVIDLPEDITLDSLTANTITVMDVAAQEITSTEFTSSNAVIGFANIANIDTTRIFSTGNITGTQFISTTTSLAPLRVASNVMVANLRSETSNVSNFAFVANTANYSENANNASFSVYANSAAFSNLSDFAEDAGNASLAELADLADVSYNIYGGLARQIPVQSDPGLTQFISAPTVSGSVLTWTGTTFLWSLPSSTAASASYADTAGIANYASFSGNASYSNIAQTADYVNDPIQVNITQVGSLTELEVIGPVSFTDPGNITLTGGLTGQGLRKSNTGSLEWCPLTSPGGSDGDIQYLSFGTLQGAGNNYFKYDPPNRKMILADGSSFVEIGTDGVLINYNNGLTVSESPVELTGGSSLLVTGTSSFGPIGNVKITGGTSGQSLTTDGSGNLSWTTINPVIDGGTF